MLSSAPRALLLMRMLYSLLWNADVADTRTARVRVAGRARGPVSVNQQQASIDIFNFQEAPAVLRGRTGPVSYRPDPPAARPRRDIRDMYLVTNSGMYRGRTSRSCRARASPLCVNR